MLDQQSDYSQPMSNSVGNKESYDQFLMKSALQEQQFRHELALGEQEQKLERQVLSTVDLY